VPSYRKKPVVIEAMQFDGRLESAVAIYEWSNPSRDPGKAPVTLERDDGTDPGYLTVETREGNMRAIPGDFIIRGVAGEFYPCKPDIFLASYDALPPAPPPTPGVVVNGRAVKFDGETITYGQLVELARQDGHMFSDRPTITWNRRKTKGPNGETIPQIGGTLAPGDETIVAGHETVFNVVETGAA